MDIIISVKRKLDNSAIEWYQSYHYRRKNIFDKEFTIFHFPLFFLNVLYFRIEHNPEANQAIITVVYP